MEVSVRRLHRRGSALIFAVILIAAITIFFVGAQELMMGSVRAQQRFENRIKAQLAMESAVASVVSEFRHGLLTLPATRTVTVAGTAVTATATDNSGAVPKTMKISTSMTLKGTTFSDAKVVGQRFEPSPWDYALFINGSNSWLESLTTGSLGANGSAYIGSNVTGGGITHTINGDLECAGSINMSQFNVTGTAWPQCPSILFTTPHWPVYAAAADTIVLASSVNGYTFTNFGAAKTHLLFKDGNLSIQGNFVGNGVIYVNGKASITDSVTVSGGKLVIISEQDVQLNRDSVAVNAFLFAEATLKVSARYMVVTGAVVADQLEMNKMLTIIHDPYFTNNPSERARFKLPGYWP